MIYFFEVKFPMGGVGENNIKPALKIIACWGWGGGLKAKSCIGEFFFSEISRVHLSLNDWINLSHNDIDGLIKKNINSSE